MEKENLVHPKFFDSIWFTYIAVCICEGEWISNFSQIPSRQNCRKSNMEECIFDDMASYIGCRFNKNSLLQCHFLAILPAGKHSIFVLLHNIYRTQYLPLTNLILLFKFFYSNSNLDVSSRFEWGRYRVDQVFGISTFRERKRGKNQVFI